jgi:hypothetical protein
LYTITYDGSTIRFYKDGNEIDNQPATGAITHTTTYPTVIGQGQAPYTDHLNGKVDDLRIYNRALSAPEVQALYQNL